MSEEMLPAVVPDDTRSLEQLEQLEQGALEFAVQSIPKNSRLAYQNDWGQFADWCKEHRLESLPAEPHTVSLYLTYLANHAPGVRNARGRRFSSIARALSTLGKAHSAAGHPRPLEYREVRMVYEGLRRTLHVRQKQARPLMLKELLLVAANIDDEEIRGVRDRAILLVGWIGGFRRSELTALQVEDLGLHGEGIQALIRSSKTDQAGEGRVKVIPYAEDPSRCPVRALRKWIQRAGIEESWVFRGVLKSGKIRSGRLSDWVIDQIVKDRTKEAELGLTGFSSHSLRAGFATEAEERGIPGNVTDEQCGWTSPIMRARYARHNLGSRFEALRKFGL